MGAFVCVWLCVWFCVCVCVCVEYTKPVEILELTSWQEEADKRIVPHAFWAVHQGCERLVVISNDTDSIVRLLYSAHSLQRNGLKDIWIEFGTGEKRRLLPLHIISDQMGEPLCRVLFKAHILTGDDITSSIGTKLAAMQCNPLNHLTGFGEKSELGHDDISQAVLCTGLVRCPIKTKCQNVKTFDELRLHVHLNAPTPTVMTNIPPTSSVIRGHIRRAFYVARKVVDHTANDLDCCQFGWENAGGGLKPSKCMNPLPPDIMITCKCTGKCESRRCICK